MNNFNYIITLKGKRNEHFSNNKNIIKKLSGREDSICSCLGAREIRYAPRYHACMVSGVNRLINKISFKKEGLPSRECFNCFVRHLGTFFGTQ